MAIGVKQTSPRKIVLITLGFIIGQNFPPLFGSANNQDDYFGDILAEVKQERTQSITNATITYQVVKEPRVSCDEVGCNGTFQNNKTYAAPTNEWKKQGSIYDPLICDYLDFAVTGFAKCGTATLNYRLRQHNEIRMQNAEWPYFSKRPIMHISKLYKQEVMKKGPGLQGYKNPHDIQYPKVLKFYRMNCPNTKLIVTIRHPVLWFESFYNYAILYHDLWRFDFDHPNKMLKCKKPNHVCASVGAFHQFLSMLGKTPLVEHAELSLLSGRPQNFDQQSAIEKVPNPVLLLENNQLSAGDEATDDAFRKGLQDYLGLNAPFTRDDSRQNDGAKLVKRKTKTAKKTRFIKICDEEYSPIRAELMAISRNASLWIRKYFIASSDVVVLNREHFLSLMENWMEDPCLKS